VQIVVIRVFGPQMLTQQYGPASNSYSQFVLLQKCPRLAFKHALS